MKDYLKSFNILTDDEIDNFASKVKSKSLKKGEYFIKEGETCSEIAFIASGFVRSYYHSSTGEETTYCLSLPNTFITAYSSFLTQSKTVESIQALCDVELYTISRDEILKMEETSINSLRFSKFIAEQEYIKLEQRIFLLQTETAETRYQNLLDTQPELLQLIPLSYLASYLGITQRHLSRIRKVLSN